MIDIIAIIGPSGVGKSTVAYKLIEALPAADLAHSYTTRAPRADGKRDEYVYVSREEFASLVAEGKMLEYMEYSAASYGTPISELERIHGKGQTAVLVLDLEGAKSIRKSAYSDRAVIVYLYQELDAIERRLRGRGDPEEKISDRMSNNRRDYLSLPELAGLFDAFVFSADGGLDSIVERILHVVNSGNRSIPLAENTKIAIELAESAAR